MESNLIMKMESRRWSPSAGKIWPRWVNHCLWYLVCIALFVVPASAQDPLTAVGIDFELGATAEEMDQRNAIAMELGVYAVRVLDLRSMQQTIQPVDDALMEEMAGTNMHAIEYRGKRILLVENRIVVESMTTPHPVEHVVVATDLATLLARQQKAEYLKPFADTYLDALSLRAKLDLLLATAINSLKTKMIEHNSRYLALRGMRFIRGADDVINIYTHEEHSELLRAGQ